MGQVPDSVKSDGDTSRVGSVRPEWVPALPATVLDGEHDAIDPVALRAANGRLLVAAGSRDSRSVMLSQSEDDGANWQVLGAIAHAAECNRITVGAGGSLEGGRLVLAIHEWQDDLPWTYTGCSPLYHYRLKGGPYAIALQDRRHEISGRVEWVAEEPRGVHHYTWSGFARRSTLKVLLSDDGGRTWTNADCDPDGGPIAPSAMGRVFPAAGALWLAGYGPADHAEMDGALGSVGLMRSDDNGKSWRFSHWLARADRDRGIGYGPGEIAVLPDGRWLGMLQGNYRGLGDFARPRICRTVSTDGGRTWSAPAPILLGPKPSLALLDDDRLMVGTRQDRGIIFNMMLNAGEALHYQDHLWDCIGYQVGDRGGLHLLNLDADTILATYHWMDEKDVTRCEIRSQLLRRRESFRPDVPVHQTPPPKRRWRMAEAYQAPDIPDAPGGLRIGTLLKLTSGDWLAIGYGQTFTGEGSYGFTGKGFVVVRAPDVEGPWARAGLVEGGGDAVSADPGTGSETPGVMIQTTSGRLLLPIGRGTWTSHSRDLELIFSDDEGSTWASLGFVGSRTGLRGVTCGSRIQQLEDGRLIWALHVTREGWHATKGDLCYVVSSDDGVTWSKPRTWATSQERHYPELPHDRDGWVRNECALICTGPGRWLGAYREERGTTAPADKWFGPSSMPHVCFTRSEDDGRTWTPSFGFLGVEMDMAALGDGAVLCAYREDTLADAWLSYDDGRTWQLQMDPAELPWPSNSPDPYCQWPPGGESVIRVLDRDTAVVITDTGLMPACKPLPPDHVLTRELHGRVQVRFFRRGIA
jgi:hypothetical protein